MNYLDYINQPILKAFFGNKMPTLGPNASEKDVKKFQDWAVDNGYMQQSDLVGKGYGSYGPLTTAAYKKAIADQKGSSAKTKQPELVQPGVYYLSHPGHKINLKGQVTKNDLYAPLGHGGVVIVGNDGSVTQYDYGRYTGSDVIGTHYEKNDGNWKSTKKGTLDLSSSTYDQLLQNVADTGAHGSSNVRLTFAHNADPEKVREAIMNDANAIDRDVYGVGFVAKAKRDQLKDSDEGLLHRIREFGTTKGYAQSAYDTIQEGVPFWNKAFGTITRIAAPIFSAGTAPVVNAISELTSRDRDGAGAWIGFSPRGAERKLQRQGYKTYDSDDYF